MIPCTFGLRPADGLLHSNKYLADIMLFEETTCLLPVHSTWELINLALGETELKKTFTLTQNISHTLKATGEVQVSAEKHLGSYLLPPAVQGLSPC